MRSLTRALPVALVLGLGLGAPTLALAQHGPHPSLTLSGTGEVRAAPDMATITTGVTTQAETAREALDANTAAMDELIAVLEEAGLEERDIQTTDFTVSPQYAYADQPDETGFTPPPRITGYEVANAVTITVRNLDDLGAILDRAVSVGANTIRGIAFSIEDPKALYARARERAVEDAMAKARTYDEAAKIDLGRIVSISENANQPPPQPMYRAQAMEMAADASVPVQGGEVAYSVTTTITWRIDEDDD